MDEGRRISPASRDHMPLKSELELNMAGLHHDIPPQLLPVSPFFVFLCTFLTFFFCLSKINSYKFYKNYRFFFLFVFILKCIENFDFIDKKKIIRMQIMV